MLRMLMVSAIMLSVAIKLSMLSFVLLSVAILAHHAECHYAERLYSDCRGAVNYNSMFKFTKLKIFAESVFSLSRLNLNFLLERNYGVNFLSLGQ